MSLSVGTIGAASTAVISRQAVAEQQLQVNQVKSGKVQADGNRVEDSRAITKTFGMTADKIEISEQGRKALEQLYAAKASKLAAPSVNSVSKKSIEAAEQPSNIKTTAPVEPAARLEAPERKQTNSVSEAAAEQGARPQPEIAQQAAKADEAQQINTEIAGITQDKPRPEFEPVMPEQEQAKEPVVQEAPAPAAAEESVSSSELQNMSVSELRTAVTEGTITPAQMDDELSRRESAQQQAEQKSEQVQQAMAEAVGSMDDMNKAVENLGTFNTVKQYAAVAQALS